MNDWQKGPPPQDGQWYVVNYGWGESLIGIARWDKSRGCFCDDGGTDYRQLAIYRHIPTPIQLPKES